MVGFDDSPIIGPLGQNGETNLYSPVSDWSRSMPDSLAMRRNQSFPVNTNTRALLLQSPYLQCSTKIRTVFEPKTNLFILSEPIFKWPWIDLMVLYICRAARSNICGGTISNKGPYFRYRTETKCQLRTNTQWITHELHVELYQNWLILYQTYVKRNPIEQCKYLKIDFTDFEMWTSLVTYYGLHYKHCYCITVYIEALKAQIKLYSNSDFLKWFIEISMWFTTTKLYTIVIFSFVISAFVEFNTTTIPVDAVRQIYFF